MSRSRRPLWTRWWSSFVTTAAWRKRHCQVAGTHVPELIEGGSRKLCFTCGAW